MEGVLHRPEKSDILNPESVSDLLWQKGEHRMEHLYEKALESAEYIKTHTKKRPECGGTCHVQKTRLYGNWNCPDGVQWH